MAAGIDAPNLYQRLQREIDRREATAGVSAAELLDLPDELQGLVSLLMRRGDVAVADAAASMRIAEDEAERLADILAEKGIVTVSEGASGRRMRIRLARRRARRAPVGIWEALADKLGDESDDGG